MINLLYYLLFAKKFYKKNNPIKLKNGLGFATVKKLNDAPSIVNQNTNLMR